MALLNLFKLSKLTVEGYEKPERTGTPLGKFEAQYNPDSLSMRYEAVYQGKPGKGSGASEDGFSYHPPSRLSVALVLDGTHVDHMGVELLRHVPTVAEQIEKFLEVCYRVRSKTHEPAYLKVSWDQGVLGPAFHCRLESVDIKYASFGRNGAPLHAELNAVFVQRLDPKKKVKQEALSSPDLTHRRVVLDGDTLPLLCEEIYGSSAHYLRVAQVNGLDDFRALRPGQELIFPPYERPGRA